MDFVYCLRTISNEVLYLFFSLKSLSDMDAFLIITIIRNNKIFPGITQILSE